MNNSTSIFKMIYDIFILIKTKKNTLILFILIFTILGFVNYHYKIINNGKEQKIVTEITSNFIHNEIIISYLESINEMNNDQKMLKLKLTNAEANSLKKIQCFLIPLPFVNSDLNTKSIIKLEINYSNNKYIQKIINHIILYLKKQPYIVDKYIKFNLLLNKKRELIKRINYEIIRLNKNELSFNSFLEYKNVNTIDLFKFKLRLETEVIDSASISFINKGIVKNNPNTKILSLLKAIIVFPIIGFALAIIYIYFKQSIQLIINEKLDLIKKTDIK